MKLKSLGKNDKSRAQNHLPSYTWEKWFERGLIISRMILNQAVWQCRGIFWATLWEKPVFGDVRPGLDSNQPAQLQYNR